ASAPARYRASVSGRASFFFQAEDGIRDRNVTGVQTCALPILQYFTAHGWWGMAAIVIVLLLSSWLLSSLTEWGRNHRNDTSDPFTDICGKTRGTVFRFCVPVFVFMIAVTMFAGGGGVLGDVFGRRIWGVASGRGSGVAIPRVCG